MLIDGFLSVNFILPLDRDFQRVLLLQLTAEHLNLDERQQNHYSLNIDLIGNIIPEIISLFTEISFGISINFIHRNNTWFENTKNRYVMG